MSQPRYLILHRDNDDEDWCIDSDADDPQEAEDLFEDCVWNSDYGHVCLFDSRTKTGRLISRYLCPPCP